MPTYGTPGSRAAPEGVARKTQATMAGFEGDLGVSAWLGVCPKSQIRAALSVVAKIKNCHCARQPIRGTVFERMLG